MADAGVKVPVVLSICAEVRIVCSLTEGSSSLLHSRLLFIRSTFNGLKQS